MVNKYNRYQTGLVVEDLFPTLKETCACGCGNRLTGRQKKWFSKECQLKALNVFYITKGDVKYIRNLIYQRDNGFCRCCGVYDKNWQADHIKPVYLGGGACDLSNFQTLCIDCHKEKSSYRVPYRLNIQASGINIINPFLGSFRALSKQV